MTGNVDTGLAGERPTVSVLIVAYQSMAVIAECLESVFQHTSTTDFEVLLIDNGPDGTGAWVEEQFEQVRLIPSQGNIGFGPANNVLAQHARGQFLVFLNPDTIIQPGAIDQLLAFARARPDGAAWGGTILAPSGQPDVSNQLTLPSLSRYLFAALGMEARFANSRRTHDLDAERRVSALCGAFFMMRSDYFHEIGGFDDSFFLYSEELDLFQRVAADGDPIYATPDSRVTHLIGTTGTMSQSRMVAKARGAMHFARKHWSKPRALTAGALIWIAALERSVVGLFIPKRSSRLARMGRASWAVCARPGQWWHGYRGRNDA